MTIRKKEKPSTTPPTGNSKTVAKRGKKPAPPAKKVRAAKQNYGYIPGAEISIEAEKNYRARRGQVYAVLVACDGKKVEDFAKKAVKVLGKESPRGWVQFFVRDGACSLSGGAEA